MAQRLQLHLIAAVACIVLSSVTQCVPINFVPMNCKQPNHFALTFDDGPSDNIPALLSHLHKAKVKATFFLIGQNMEDKPNLVKMIHSAGHMVGSHTYSHLKLSSVSDATIRSELKLSDQQFLKILGFTPRLFRYPYGKRSTNSENIVRNEFRKVSVMWSVDIRDWEEIWSGVKRSTIFARFPDQISDMKRAKRGPIALFHDYVPGSVEQALNYIDYIKSQGYKLVTADVCLGINPDIIYARNNAKNNGSKRATKAQKRVTKAKTRTPKRTPAPKKKTTVIKKSTTKKRATTKGTRTVRKRSTKG